MNLRLIVFLQILCFIKTVKVNTCIPCTCQKIGKFTIAQCSHKILKLSEIPSTIQSNINELHFNGQKFKELRNNTFALFNNLTNISFDNNIIEKVETGAFQHLSKLRILILSYNEIRTLPDGVFLNLKLVEDINLFNNNIFCLQKHLFFDLPKLKSIKLSYNNISTIEEGCFAMLPSLKEVFLLNNKLKTVQISVIDKPTNLKYFKFNGNPWNCDEKLCSLLKYASKDSMYGITCETPEYLKHKTWNDLTLEGYSLNSSMQPLNVMKGETAQLECRYCFAQKEKEIKWSINTSNYINESNYPASSSGIHLITLTLKNVSESDVGYFSCYAENCSTCNVTIFLNVFNGNLSNLRYIEDGSKNTTSVTVIDLTILYISAGASLVIILLCIIVVVCIFYCKTICSQCKQHEDNKNEPAVLSFLVGDDPLPFPSPEPVSSRRSATLNSQINTRTQINQNSRTDNNSPCNSPTFCCNRITTNTRRSENHTNDQRINSTRRNERGRSNLPLLEITY